jgi:hypothetical protein
MRVYLINIFIIYISYSGSVWVKVEAPDPTCETPEQEEEECSDIQQLCRTCAQHCSRSLASLLHNNPALICQLSEYFGIEVRYIPI